MNMHAVVITAAVLFSQSAATPLHTPIDVCTASRDLLAYKNKVVSVRGLMSVVYGKPFPHAFYFEELHEPRCMVDGKARSVRIRLLSPEEDFLAHPPLGYHFDEDSLRQVEEQFEAQRKYGEPVRALVTVEGFLRPPTRMSRRARSATKTPPGLNFDAEIIVQSMKDPVFLNGKEQGPEKLGTPERNESSKPRASPRVLLLCARVGR